MLAILLPLLAKISHAQICQPLPTRVSLQQPSVWLSSPYLATEAEIDCHSDFLSSEWQSQAESNAGMKLTDYSVGSIPILPTVSPSGGRIYTVPIGTVPGWKLSPDISLVYNSQTGDNVAGFGWGLSGLSAITVRNKNYYYDGKNQGSLYDSSSAEYSLDGTPIVRHSSGLPDYSYTTVRGNILVKKNLAPSGETAYFEVLFPNGTTGIFGYTKNNEAKNFYPLTKLEDIDGNVITFTYKFIGESYYIERIEYGFDASMDFDWGYRSNATPDGFASYGNMVSFPSSILKTITCKDGKDELHRYILTHEIKDGVPLLKRIDCSTSSVSLPPLMFMYGIDTKDESEMTQTFNMMGWSLFAKYFTKSEDVELVHKRGRFIPNNTYDGIVIYPSFENYGLIDNHKYGSKYPPEQEILCNISGVTPVIQKTILAEKGFQVIESVDVNGDGTDELVKINSSSTIRGTTDFNISIYSFGLNGNMSTRSFRVSIKDCSSNKYSINPAECFYKFGDFRGNGKKMLLIMSRNSFRFAVVDLYTRSKVSENSLFPFEKEDVNLGYIQVLDLENDGQEDLCRITDSGIEVYSLSTGSEFSLRTLYSGVSKEVLGRDPQYLEDGFPIVHPAKIFAVDINGDGYLDIAAAPSRGNEDPSNVWNIAKFNGKRFYTQTTSLDTRYVDDEIFFQDVDKDGLPEMFHLRDSTLYYIQNKNGTFGGGPVKKTKIPLGKSSSVVPGFMSLHNTNAGDLMVISDDYVYLYAFDLDHRANRRLTKMTDSFGRESTNTYGDISLFDGSYATDYQRSYSNSNGYMRTMVPIIVLFGEQTSINGTNLENRVYTYFDAVYHNQGLGFCGFGKIRQKDYVSRTTTTRTFNPEKFGIETNVAISKFDSETPYSTVTNTYDDNSTYYGKLNPRLTGSVSTDALTGIETTTSYAYDTYDFPKKIQTSRRIGSGTAQTEEVSMTYNHSIALDKYVLGAVTEESVIKDMDGSSTLKWKERSVVSYDSRFRPVSRKRYVGRYGYTSGESLPALPVGDSLKKRLTLLPDLPPPDTVGVTPPDTVGDVFPDSTDIADPDIVWNDAVYLVSETRWTYDSSGNVTSEKSAPYNASELTGFTCTYDDAGRHVLTKTDALGRTTAYGGYNKFGMPTTVTDWLGRTTIYTYDEWGNLTEKIHADGTVDRTETSWGGPGLYTVKSSGTGQPEQATYYDALGRVVRSGVKRFDGRWQYVDTEYDGQGRVSRTSLPFRDSSSVLWDTYSYDIYGRPICLTAASGKEITWEYKGTSVTTVRDGIWSTSTTDASGNVVSVTDAGGSIVYKLQDDGQPISITAPGNVRTLFSYDNYGRRTKIVDPSAGTQTESYVWNADGSSKVTHTNPNGIVITHRDKYGRTTFVERPGEYNTTYNFDEYGRVSGEQSTNGTGIEYAYDGMGRITSTRETVPDGKWLRKVYTYTTGSVLSTVQYITPSGPVTTEQYLYANGHNTGISLSDGTVVWRLESENDLGMATKITTGGITREYGFTAYGMPTYRKMDQGALQDFSYQFDPLTGNLLMRQDIINGNQETFGYDALNRLTAIGDRQITYADNGNITSMDGVGTLFYGSITYPYRITALKSEHDGLVPDRDQNVSYTCYSRPSILTEGGRSVAFTYNGDGGRVKMYVADGTSQVLSRYYIADRYEYDQTPAGNKERLYLGGDAYSAPMVYQRENGGSWTIYNIGRDYLGNITHIANEDGTPVAEYSYDPWGRLRNPETLEIYPAGSEPELFLGRGFTAHEHLTWFGLINMNARLYDPLLGRFLSPDPYVQAPDFTQNYNRYSYALNNPLKYIDESGEFLGTILTAIKRIPALVIDVMVYGAKDAWNYYCDRVSNAFKIDMGLFATDSNLSQTSNFLSIISRFTWEAIPTFLGNAFSHIRNNIQRTNIEYYGGATLVNSSDPSSDLWGLTLGPYINGQNLVADPAESPVFAHEYGHTKQSKYLGPLYPFIVGLPSLFGSISDYYLNLSDHDKEWYEVWANQLSYDYFDKHGDYDTTEKWKEESNPRNQDIDGFFYFTLAYYAGLIGGFFLIF